MWNLKSKTKQMNKYKAETVIDTENKQVVARGEVGWHWRGKKLLREIEVQTSSCMGVKGTV